MLSKAFNAVADWITSRKFPLSRNRLDTLSKAAAEHASTQWIAAATALIQDAREKSQRQLEVQHALEMEELDRQIAALNAQRGQSLDDKQARARQLIPVICYLDYAVRELNAVEHYCGAGAPAPAAAAPPATAADEPSVEGPPLAIAGAAGPGVPGRDELGGSFVVVPGGAPPPTPADGGFPDGFPGTAPPPASDPVPRAIIHAEPAVPRAIVAAEPAAPVPVPVPVPVVVPVPPLALEPTPEPTPELGEPPGTRRSSWNLPEPTLKPSPVPSPAPASAPAPAGRREAMRALLEGCRLDQVPHMPAHALAFVNCLGARLVRKRCDRLCGASS
jgi:hypothetical protein